ncbi:MAG: PQQ-dependent sugar dehydrogenase, partial [Fibrobacteria bacterium]
MRKTLPLAAFTALIPLGVWAQSTCHQPTAAEYKVTALTELHSGVEEAPTGSWGPVGMAIAPDGSIYVAKMKTGEIVVLKPGASNTTVVGKISTWFSTEDGLLGIALDPKFATNHWLYALYSDPCGLNCANRAEELARFNVADGTLASKKVIMRYPRAKNDDHHGA